MSKNKSKKRKKQTKKPVASKSLKNSFQLPNGIEIVVQEEMLRTEAYPRLISSHYALSYLLSGGLYQRLSEFLDFYFSKVAKLVPINELIALEAVYLLFPHSYESGDDEAFVPAINTLSSSIITPIKQYLEQTYEGYVLRLNAKRIYQERVRGLLDHAVCVIGSNGELCHIIDLKSVGNRSEEEFEQIYADAGIDFDDIEIRKLACDGFIQTCNYIARNKKGDRHHLLDWYLFDFKLTENRSFCRRILRHMQMLSQKNRAEQEFILAYYDHNRDLFNSLFEKNPDLDFIEHGKCQRFELLGDFVEKLGITMEEVYNSADFFPPESREGVSNTNSSANKTWTPPITDKEYRTAVFKALDRFYRKVIHRSSVATWYNIWPDSVKKTAEIIGRFVVIVYEYQDEYWILVDSIQQGNAIYLWHGKELNEGLAIFERSRAYARKQEGVLRRYHAMTRKSPFDIYRAMLADAGGVDVLR